MRFPPISVLILVLSIAVATGLANAADPESIANAPAESSSLDWPQATQTARPWTRWWWHGSAVDEENLTRCLETYHAAGIGGVEITCIYGVQGQEKRDIPFLSDRWVDVIAHTTREAKRLEMGVDLPPGSGWRIGGPNVERADGNADVDLQSEQVDGGKAFRKGYATPNPQVVIAYGADGEIVELTSKIDSSGQLSWEAPQENGPWTVRSLGMRLTGEKVKRPGPGGEGFNINPYASRPISRYLEDFGGRIDLLPPCSIRASFHDSFEYEGSWCDDFLEEFRSRRGYPLEQHLPALSGNGSPEKIARVKCDYRETISDLVLHNLIERWVAWSHERGQLARNQAHGSPGNWLDLYAAADIPETESFGRLENGDMRPLLFRFASSAAHVAGRELVSSETATWLDEHFTVTLDQIKKLVDQQFLAGINHTIFHGTAYSPADAEWPGWLFYASTQLNPQNTIWHDLPALNQYITRCQSQLQSGSPDNDLLVYWPIHDVWQHPDGLRENLTVHNATKWLVDTPFGRAAEWLESHGYAFDYISDSLLSKCKVQDGRIIAPGSTYEAILVPHARHIPASTMQRLRVLANSGGRVMFLEALPESPPGIISSEQQQEFNDAHAALAKSLGAAQFSQAAVASFGEGRLIAGDDLEDMLKTASIRHESCRSGAGIQFIRRKLRNGACYFLANSRDTRFDGWVELSRGGSSAALMDPMTGQIGRAETKGGNAIRLQLNPAESVFVRTFDGTHPGEAWRYESYAADATPIEGTWHIEFLDGGPELPAPVATDTLSSWTKLSSSGTESFAGTAACTISFTLQLAADRQTLDLGRVHNSARVFLNGKLQGTLICAPFQLAVGPFRSGKNELRVEVTSVAANRIRDLDRRGVRWQIFRDINFVDINYKPFNASNWPIRDAGLLGPVTLRALE